MSTWDQSGIMLEPWPVRRMCESSSSALGPGDPATCLRTQRARWRRSLSSLSHGHVAATRGERGETRATVFYWGQHLDTINAFYGSDPQDERHEEYNRWGWPPVPHEERRRCPRGGCVPGVCRCPGGGPGPPARATARTPARPFILQLLLGASGDGAVSGDGESENLISGTEHKYLAPAAAETVSVTPWWPPHSSCWRPPWPPCVWGRPCPGTRSTPTVFTLSCQDPNTTNMQTWRYSTKQGYVQLTSSYICQKCWMELIVGINPQAQYAAQLLWGQISFLHHVFCFLSQVHKCT